MPIFEYSALNANGKKEAGTEAADTASDIRHFIRQKGWVPLTVSEFNTATTQKKRFFWKYPLKRNPKLSKSQLALITRQLATLLEAGMPLDEALLCVAEQQEKNTTQQIVLAIHSKISEGFGLADALALFPNSFPIIYRTTVAAAEKSGKMDHVLISLAEYTEKQQKIKRQIQQALIYPCVMSLVAFSVVLFLLLHIVPTIIQVFIDSKQTLPLATQILLKITHLLQADGWLIGLALSLAVIGLTKLLRIRKYRFWLDTSLLRIPVLGKTIASINSARFARSFGILQAATVPVLDALSAANALVRPLPMREAVSTAINRVREGKGIADSLASCPHFSRMLIHLIHSGEQSGRLADMLNKAASTQEDDVEALIQGALSLFEPLMIILMGGVVLFIVLAVMLPIFSLDQLAGQT
jgi:general secretion pathway protein F